MLFNIIMIHYLALIAFSSMCTYLYNIYSKVNIDMSESMTQKLQAANISNNNEVDNNCPDRIIVFYKGEKYDITDFAKSHPGGKRVLCANADKEISQIMIENEHSDHAYELLKQYKIA